MGQYRPGTEAAVRLYRNGELIEQTVVLGSSPTNVAVAETPAARTERGNPLGFELPNWERKPDKSPVWKACGLLSSTTGPVAKPAFWKEMSSWH